MDAIRFLFSLLLWGVSISILALIIYQVMRLFMRRATNNRALFIKRRAARLSQLRT